MLLRNPYVSIARPDHWIKNIFVLPGVIIAYFFYPSLWQENDLWGIAAGVLAVCLVASSNYVLNELLDAERDRHHPVKKERPIASGRVNERVAWAEWILLGAAGIGLGFWLFTNLGIACAALWIMGTLYNIPPIRLKDLPYADVLSESVNNPIRMAAGWACSGLTSTPPLSILLSYWMFGAFLMATKRLAEYRAIGDPARAARYRSSFGFYTEERLMVSILFYASLFAMFAAVFMTRYRFELVLATPLVALAMAYYLHLSYSPNSPAQYPERLYREPWLMIIVGAAFAACGILLFWDLPAFDQLFVPAHRPPVSPPF